jgi:hypothetical protein
MVNVEDLPKFTGSFLPGSTSLAYLMNSTLHIVSTPGHDPAVYWLQLVDEKFELPRKPEKNIRRVLAKEIFPGLVSDAGEPLVYLMTVSRPVKSRGKVPLRPWVPSDSVYEIVNKPLERKERVPTKRMAPEEEKDDDGEGDDGDEEEGECEGEGEGEGEGKSEVMGGEEEEEAKKEEEVQQEEKDEAIYCDYIQVIYDLLDVTYVPFMTLVSVLSRVSAR